MHAPLQSTLTLFAELVISIIIYYIFYQGYKNNKFPVKLAAFSVLYEIIFNITYMASRVKSQVNVSKFELPIVIAFAIIHGILSLIMFIALIVFLIFAFLSYRKGNNYFKEHKFLTTIFLIFWTIAILSGIIFYVMDYIL